MTPLNVSDFRMPRQRTRTNSPVTVQKLSTVTPLYSILLPTSFIFYAPFLSLRLFEAIILWYTTQMLLLILQDTTTFEHNTTTITFYQLPPLFLSPPLAIAAAYI